LLSTNVVFILYFRGRNYLVLKWSRKINKFVCGSEEKLIAIIISQLPGSTGDREQMERECDGELSALLSISALHSLSLPASFFCARK
jgi:hypothetical protein